MPPRVMDNLFPVLKLSVCSEGLFVELTDTRGGCGAFEGGVAEVDYNHTAVEMLKVAYHGS